MLQARTRRAFGANLAGDNYGKWIDTGDEDALLTAWNASRPLIRWFVRKKLRLLSPHDRNEVVAGMEAELLDRLTRHKIPAGRSSGDYARYLTGCCARWMIDALRELSAGREIPEQYRPPRSSWGSADDVEAGIFAKELIDVAPAKILEGCRFGDAFKTAATYAIEELCEGRRPSLVEIRRRWRRGEPWFVADWCTVQLRQLLAPIRDQLSRRPDMDMEVLWKA